MKLKATYKGESIDLDSDPKKIVERIQQLDLNAETKEEIEIELRRKGDLPMKKRKMTREEKRQKDKENFAKRKNR